MREKNGVSGCSRIEIEAEVVVAWFLHAHYETKFVNRSTVWWLESRMVAIVDRLLFWAMARGSECSVFDSIRFCLMHSMTTTTLCDDSSFLT
jgi:hypothetical protein